VGARAEEAEGNSGGWEMGEIPRLLGGLPPSLCVSAASPFKLPLVAAPPRWVSAF